jgi:hypothetical protein
MPQALLLIVSALGAAIAARLIAREWRRVNEELDRMRAEPARAEAPRERIPVLRRDPATGVYRPQR